MSKLGPGDRVFMSSGNSSKQSGVTSSTAQTTRRHHHPQQQGLWIAPGVTTSEVWSDLPQRIAEGGYRVDSFSRPLHQPVHHTNTTSNAGMYYRQPPPAYDPHLPNPTPTMPDWPYQTGPSSQPVLLRNFNGAVYTTSPHHHQLAPGIVYTTQEHQQQRQRRITRAMYWITASLLLSATATALLLVTGHNKYSSSNLQSTTVSPSSSPLSVSSRSSVTGDDISSSTYYYYYYPNKTDDDSMSAVASWKTNMPTSAPQQQNLISTRTPTIHSKPTIKAEITPSIVRDSNVQPFYNNNGTSSSINATLGNITASENVAESTSTNSTNSTLDSSSTEMTTSNDNTGLNSTSIGNSSINKTFNDVMTSSSNYTTTNSSLPTDNTTGYQGDTYYYYYSTDTTRKDDNTTKPLNNSTPTSNVISSPTDTSSSFPTSGTVSSSSSTTNSNDDPFLNGGKPIQSLNDDQPNDDYSNLLSTANEIQINEITGIVNSVDDTTNTVTSSSSGDRKVDDDPIMAYADYKAQTSRGNSTFQGYDDGFDDSVQDDAFKVDDTWANQKETAFGETITGQSATEYVPQQTTNNFDKNEYDDTDDAFKK